MLISPYNELEADAFGSPRPSQLRSVLHFNHSGLWCTLLVSAPLDHQALQAQPGFCAGMLFFPTEDAIVRSFAF